MGVGFTPKSKVNNTNNSENWGMGFLFIFFPEEEEKNPNFSFKNSSSSSSSSSSLLPSFSFKSINAIRNRSSSSHLISKAQSTISICVLLIFITLLLFTLSTFEPTNSLNQKRKPPNLKFQEKLIFPPALQGMGSLYRRGTRAMNDLIVAHVIESVTEIELKMFLRLLHRSGITSKSDILFVFSSKSSSFDHAIVEENKSFLKLINGYYKYNKEEKKNYNSSSDPTRFMNSSFDPTQFVISSKKEKESGEPIWGKKIRVYEDFGNSTELTLTRLSYGSVVSFDTGELDPENSLSGFLDHVSMSLRRWACYPMLLGRVRRNYKHVLLVDVKEHLVLGDSLTQLKNRSPESVILTTLPTRKKNSEKKLVNSGFVFGGVRGVRRLANAMLTEIVRAITQHKKRNSVSESTLFNQLVSNEFVLKNVNLIVSGESTHELSSFSISKFPIVRRGNSNLDISYVFKKYLCSSPLDSIAYSDC